MPLIIFYEKGKIKMRMKGGEKKKKKPRFKGSEMHGDLPSNFGKV